MNTVRRILRSAWSWFMTLSPKGKLAVVSAVAIVGIVGSVTNDPATTRTRTDPSRPTATPSETATPAQPAATGVDLCPQQASAACFDEPWPLTVDEVELVCDAAAVYAISDGVRYAVNGMAETRGAPGIEPIWRENPEIPGTRVNIGPLIDAGLTLCE